MERHTILLFLCLLLSTYGDAANCTAIDGKNDIECTCNGQDCKAGQYCHPSAASKCFNLCNSASTPPLTSECQCGSTDKAPCSKGSYCDSTTSSCLPTCPTTGATDKDCWCGATKPNKCSNGTTCEASSSTCLNACPKTPAKAPSAGCTCGNATCSSGQTCSDASSGQCTADCPASTSAVAKPCMCGDEQCKEGQICDPAAAAQAKCSDVSTVVPSSTTTTPDSSGSDGYGAGIVFLSALFGMALMFTLTQFYAMWVRRRNNDPDYRAY